MAGGRNSRGVMVNHAYAKASIYGFAALVGGDYCGRILEAQRVMGGGLLRVVEIQTERRMEPSERGEGIYRFASVGRF